MTTQHYWAFLTASRLNLDDPSGEDCETGWVDYSWSHTELFDSRNDVEPFSRFTVSDYEALDDRIWGFNTVHEWVADTLRSAPGGPFEHNGDGTFCGQGEDTFSNLPYVMTYALHFTTKVPSPASHRDRYLAIGSPYVERDLTTTELFGTTEEN